MNNVPACGTDPVVNMPVGAYTHTVTTAVNALIRSCGKTIHFPSGAYWFDADDGTGSSESHALKIDNPHTRVIFGDLIGSGDDGEFPPACHTDTGGVDITLSSRTNLVHGQGRVAICGTVRQAAAPIMPTAINPTVVNAIDTDLPSNCPFEAQPGDNNFSIPAGFRADGTSAIRAQFTVNLANGTNYDCTFRDVASLDMSFDVADQPINAAVIRLVGGTNYGNGQKARTEFDVLNPADGSVFCSAVFRRINDAHTEVAYDLLGQGAESNTCVDPSGHPRLTNRLQLAKIRVRFLVHGFVYDSNETYPVASAGNGCGQVVSNLAVAFCVEVSKVTLTSGWTLTANGFDPTAPTGQVIGNLDKARAVGGGTASLTVPQGVPAAVFGGKLLDYRYQDDDPYVPAGGIDGLGLLISGSSQKVVFPGTEGPNQTEVAGSSTPGQGDHGVYVKARLEWPGPSSRQCGGSTYGIPQFDESVYLDLMHPTAGVDGLPNCSTFPLTPRDLVGVSVRLEVFSGNATAAVLFPWNLPTSLKASMTESIDAVSLVVVPHGPYTNPDARNQVTVGEGAGNSSFNVFGGFSTPHNDLTVNWTGTLRSPDQPVIVGNAVVHSVQSSLAPSATPGIICCAVGQPSERNVALTASVDNRKVAHAQVTYKDWPIAGATVQVKDWLICRTRPSGCVT